MMVVQLPILLASLSFYTFTNALPIIPIDPPVGSFGSGRGDIANLNSTDSATAALPASATDSASLSVISSYTTAFIIPASAVDPSLLASVTNASLSTALTGSSPLAATVSSFVASATGLPLSGSVTVANLTDASTATDSDSVPTDVSTPLPTTTSIPIPIPPPACVALSSSPPITVASATVSALSTDAPSDAPLTTADVNTTTATFSAAVESSAIPASTDASPSDITNSSTASTSAFLPSATNVQATPSSSLNPTLSRRIAQSDLPAVAQSWQDLCLVSGGDIFTNEPCVTLAGINGINALLGNADPCAQQDNADAMIDFAKSPGVTNTDALIANAISYRQHPRNAIDIEGVTPSTPYCQRAPRNPELSGIVNSQLPGVNIGIFGSPSLGMVAFGDNSTCPFGQTPDVTSCSCS